MLDEYQVPGFLRRDFQFLLHFVDNHSMAIAAAIIASIIIALLLLGLYFVRFALMRRDFDFRIMPDKEKAPSPEKAERKRIIDGNAERFRSFTEGFMEKCPPEPVSVVSSDGLTLRGEIHRKDGHRYAILIHGYKGERWQMRNLAAVYAGWGYTTLLPDNRAHGESDGRWVGMGWLDKDDIRKWIDWIVECDDEARIVIHGISMGGATVMMASGLDLPENVRAAVEDCGYTSVWDIFCDELKAIYHLPPFPILCIFDMLSSLIAGYSPRKASSLGMLEKSTIPMLFIHGSDDHFVGTYMLERNFTAKTHGSKEKLLVQDAGHGESYLRDPELYFSTVADFLDRSLNA